MRTLSFAAILLAGLASASSYAAGPAPAAGADTKAGDTSCMDVTVNGYHASPYDCLTQQMAPAPTAGDKADPGQASGAIANRPSNQLGMFNEQTTANRMGNTFGKSAFPQRPPPANFGSPLMNGR